MPDTVAELRERLHAAARVTILTGAGVSAGSGVPTFRGPHGLWRNYRAEDLATPQVFARDPQLVWEWYDWRRTLIASCRPNAAHEAIARLSTRPGFTLVTQNVDGLHELAGTRHVVRIHGSIWEVRCTGCGHAREDRRAPLPSLPPACARCGALERPGVVWFGEAIDPDVLKRCEESLDCDVFISAGTSSVVYPAAGLIHEARRAGAFTVEINPVATEAAAHVDLVLAAPAEEVFPTLIGAE
jgi:NAD-dependent deacetylase